MGHSAPAPTSIRPSARSRTSQRSSAAPSAAAPAVSPTPSTGPEYLKTHVLSADALLLDLDAESTAILAAAKSAGVGHTAKTLVKDGPLRLLLLGFRAGATMQEHQAPGPVSIHILQGSVDITSNERSDSLARHVASSRPPNVSSTTR